MKRWIALTTLAAGACFAQDLEQHNKWMKESKELMPKLGKAVEAKNAEEANAAATRLAEINAGLEKFWTARNADDAVKIAQSSHLAAKAITTSLDAAPESINTLKKGCQGCHSAHREKTPDGKYKIK